MCQTGGRRCDRKWDDAHRERYNARRRIVRNTAKRQRAQDEGHPEKAAMYEALVAHAKDAEKHYHALITAHEAETAPQPGPPPAALEAWRGSLSDAERAAHDDYASILHEDLNSKLRAAGGAVPDNLDPTEQRMVTHLDTALARAPRAEQPYTVYRGIQTERQDGRGNTIGTPAAEWVAENAHPGQRLTMHGYTSTTLTREQADYFSGASGDYATSGVIFEIETTQGGNWPSEGPEAEVTLARGTTFEVTSIDPDHRVDGKPYPLVRLMEVPTRPEWADGDFTSKAGHTYFTVTEDKAITMRTADGAMAGYVTWGEDDVIGNMNVREEHQRQGIATALLSRARGLRPHLQHSDRLSDDARAWLNGIGER